MKRSILISLLAPILMFGPVSISYSQYTTIQLTNNYSFDDFPQINNNGHVVWNGRDDTSDYEIFLYDGTSTIQLGS